MSEEVDRVQKLEKTAPKPDTLMIVLLDEISGKLEDLLDLVKGTIPDGVTVPIKLSLSKNEEKRIVYSDYTPKPFYSITIYNEGDGAILFGINSSYDPESILYRGEQYSVDMKSNKIYYIHIKALDDTTIRMIVLY